MFEVVRQTRVVKISAVRLFLRYYLSAVVNQATGVANYNKGLDNLENNVVHLFNYDSE